MRRIAQIVLITVLTLTICFFLSINTGSALATPESFDCSINIFLLPGARCITTDNTANSLGFQVENSVPTTPVTLKFSGASNSDCTKSFILNEDHRRIGHVCNPKGLPVTVSNESTNGTVIMGIFKPLKTVTEPTE